jgi:hypothetical protein
MHKEELGFLPPSSLTDLFKDINQGAEVNLRLGTSPAHILKEDEPLLSHLLMGFKGSVKVSYASQFAEFLKLAPKGLIGVDSSDLDYLGPFLATGLQGEIGIEYEDEEELLENPIIAQFGQMKFSDALGLIGMSREQLEKNPDSEPLNAETLQKAKDAGKFNPMFEIMVVAYEVSNLITDMITATHSQGKFSLAVDAVVEGLGHSEIKLSSVGVGAAA